MLAARLIQLIQNHSEGLTRDYRNLGTWIADARDDAVRAEYEEWGRKRFAQGIPLSEIIYALILIKHHLRRYIRDHGLVEFSADAVTADELLPVHLHGIHELNRSVGQFFDRALYHLARGYEAEAEPARAAR